MVYLAKVQRWAKQNEQLQRSKGTCLILVSREVVLPADWHPPAAVSREVLYLRHISCPGQMPNLTFTSGQSLRPLAACCPAEPFHTPDFGVALLLLIRCCLGTDVWTLKPEGPTFIFKTKYFFITFASNGGN